MKSSQILLSFKKVYLYNTLVFCISQANKYNGIKILDTEDFVISERIKELRIAKGLNQVELGEKLGVTKQSVSNWENDNIQPSIEMLLKISHEFSVSTDYLLGEEHRTFIEVSNLTKTQISHIQQIIDDIVVNNT